MAWGLSVSLHNITVVAGIKSLLIIKIILNQETSSTGMYKVIAAISAVNYAPIDGHLEHHLQAIG